MSSPPDHQRFAGVFGAILVFTVTCAASPLQSVPPVGPVPAAPTALERGRERDPFAMTDRMRAEAKGVTAEQGFLPSPDLTARPSLRLKGYVEGRDEEVIALIEVSGGDTYVVREGDVLSVTHAGANVVMKIIQISNHRVSVQIGTFDHVVVVR